MKLLACPFCGRKPRITSRAASPSEDSPTKTIHFIVCMCGGYSARSRQFGYSLQEAADRWNKRPKMTSFTYPQDASPDDMLLPEN